MYVYTYYIQSTTEKSFNYVNQNYSLNQKTNDTWGKYP